MPMTTEELQPLVLDAFTRAMDKEGDAAADALDKIGNSGDWRDMYTACCGFAEIGKRALIKTYGEKAPEADGMWAIQEVVPGALGDDPAAAFATRFLIAYANGDNGQTFALFRAAYEAGGVEYVDSVCALMSNVVGVARLALEDAR